MPYIHANNRIITRRVVYSEKRLQEITAQPTWKLGPPSGRPWELSCMRAYVWLPRPGRDFATRNREAGWQGQDL